MFCKFRLGNEARTLVLTRKPNVAIMVAMMLRVPCKETHGSRRRRDVHMACHEVPDGDRHAAGRRPR